MNTEIKRECIEGPEIMPFYADDNTAYVAAMQYFSDDDSQGE